MGESEGSTRVGVGGSGAVHGVRCALLPGAGGVSEVHAIDSKGCFIAYLSQVLRRVASCSVVWCNVSCSVVSSGFVV